LCALTKGKNAYLGGVKKSYESIKKLYPGYTMRLYHDVPLEIKK